MSSYLIYRDKPLKKQLEKLHQILYKSESISKALSLIPQLKLPNWYLGSGCITQTVWNYFSDKEPNYGIKDFDLVYFDNKDISYVGEDRYVQQAKAVFKDFPFEVEIRNQARVHLWYQNKFGKEIEPYFSVEEAIATWPTTATALGVRAISPKKLSVFAPYGLHDLFGMIVRPNKVLVSKEIYEEKSSRWLKLWPNLKIIPWEQR